MPTCRDVARLLASGEYTERDFTGRLLLRLHLLMCGNCRRYRAELEDLNAELRVILQEPLDPERLAEMERRLLDRFPPPAEPPEAR